MNNEHKKYGIIKRLFNWKATYEEIISERIQLEEEYNNFKSESAFQLEKTIADYDLKLATLNEKLHTLLVQSGETNSFKEQLDTYKSTVANYNSMIENYKSDIARLESENKTHASNEVLLNEKIRSLSLAEERLRAENSSKDTSIGEIKRAMDNLQESIALDQKRVANDTNELLGIFKKTTGTAGKIAELRLEDLITKTSIESDSWTTNLTVGQDTVEFAIKAEDTNNKWIPVDSKLIGAFTPGDEIIVNDDYVKKVVAQAKKVSKYLNKSNTTQFGIMVLQSDFIYNEIYEENPEVLTNSIIENSVFIMSPSAFVQFSTAINKLSKTFEEAKKASEISGQLNLVIKHVNSMLAAWEKGFDFLRKIEDTHIRNIKSSVQKVESLKQIGYSEEEE